MMDETPFRIVRRGYDQEQVAAAVKDLQNALEVARRAVADRTTELTRVTESKTRLEAQLATLQAPSGAPDHGSSRAEPSGTGEPREASHPAESSKRSTPKHPSHGFDDLGGRIASILGLAQDEAEQLRRTAAEEAGAVRQEAAAAAQAQRAALADDRARHEAWVTESRSGATRIVAAASGQADQIRRQTQQELRDAIRRRDAVHAHLAEVNLLLAVLEDALADEEGVPDPVPASHG